MSHTTTSTVTLNIPSILAFALLSFLAIRWLFFSPSSPPPARPRTRIPYDRIAGLAAAFPQADPRKIEWDLLCNGGNAQATANRILAGQLAEVCLFPRRGAHALTDRSRRRRSGRSARRRRCLDRLIRVGRRTRRGLRI